MSIMRRNTRSNTACFARANKRQTPSARRVRDHLTTYCSAMSTSTADFACSAVNPRGHQLVDERATGAGDMVPRHATDAWLAPGRDSYHVMYKDPTGLPLKLAVALGEEIVAPADGRHTVS